jgi:hypothetical protein
MRNIRDIRDLPISQLSDEEIAKAAMYRLGTRAVYLVYHDGNGLIFIGRWREGGSKFITALRQAWEENFGKLHKIEFDTEK